MKSAIGENVSKFPAMFHRQPRHTRSISKKMDGNMRFAMTCSDHQRGVMNTLISGGWELVKLFTQQGARRVDFNHAVINRAYELGAEVQISPVVERDLRDLAARGCEALVVAGYGRRIPPWQDYLPYAVNFHPSPLPEARGYYPRIRAILENRSEWGVSCHKISERFDEGDILGRELFPLHPDECHESLETKAQMAAMRLAGRIAANFAELWANAEPQGPGSYWKQWKDEDRTLDFSAPVGDIMRCVRAFGLNETIAVVEGGTFHVRRAVGWTEAHSHAPGTLVHRNLNNMVVAAADGYIVIVEWCVFSRLDIAYTRS